MKKIKGTNYIDHRFPCADMIRSILCCEGYIVPIDIHGRPLYIIIQD